MANRLSMKTAPEAAVVEESAAIPTTPEKLMIDIPEGTDPEVVKAALASLMGLLDEDSLKKGSRNSRADSDRHQQIHDHSMALGALCAEHNCPAPEPSERVATDGSGASMTKKPAAKKSVKVSDPSDIAEDLGVPLDKMVSAVQSEFYDLRTQMRKAQAVAAGRSPEYYYDWDDDEVPCCEAVYDGYAIARIDLAYYKVPYSIEGTGIVLTPQTEWTPVKQDWITKSAALKALIKQNQRQRSIGAVKALGRNRLGNYLMVWGDEQHRDLYGEFFTKETKGLTAIFDYIGKIPALYQHAMDGVVKYDPVGTIDVLEPDPIGLWMETQLDIANEYAQAVQELARREALGSSSGALPGSRKVKATGEIYQWAIMEGSFTPTPAEPRLRTLGVSEVKAIYKECGLEFPEQESLKLEGIGGEEPRLTVDEAAIEEEQLRLLELQFTVSA